jgi:hypothetical protein
MATDDTRPPLDRFLGLGEPRHRYQRPHERHDALMERCTEAIDSENWPEAQVWALLLIYQAISDSG